MKPTVHLLCGRIGSGKTTFAKRLERETAAVRLTHDEWIVRLYGPNPPEKHYREYFVRVENQIWELAEAIVRAGADVILDFGFWSRESRDAARDRTHDAGAVARFYSMSCPRQIALDTASALTYFTPAFFRTRAICPPVVPVVMTSSTINTC